MKLARTAPVTGLSLSLVGPVLRLAAGGDHDATGTQPQDFELPLLQAK